MMLGLRMVLYEIVEERNRDSGGGFSYATCHVQNGSQLSVIVDLLQEVINTDISYIQVGVYLTVLIY
jgi:hypothetical protein